jgi:tetratricopeptide (TPR) repeat protein
MGLGNGLSAARHHEDALSVQEAELAMLRRLGTDEASILAVQANLAMTYGELGYMEKALSMERDVYSGRLKLHGEEHPQILLEASNYGESLVNLERFEEARALLRKVMPVARRVLEENTELMLVMRRNYAEALYKDPAATLDDLREAVTTLEDTERTARRVLGGAHPTTKGVERDLQKARTALREAQAPGDLCEALGAL